MKWTRFFLSDSECRSNNSACNEFHEYLNYSLVSLNNSKTLHNKYLLIPSFFIYMNWSPLIGFAVTSERKPRRGLGMVLVSLYFNYVVIWTQAKELSMIWLSVWTTYMQSEQSFLPPAWHMNALVTNQKSKSKIILHTFSVHQSKYSSSREPSHTS